ncbi:MAG: hypothetical protein CMJ18_18060 [Phycisphaeraceae bacterium]|nr:hypothetical protein [Phycisphaeraceae bacterium]
MAEKSYRAAIMGLGMMGGADQVSAEAIGQSVATMDGTHLEALRGHERVDVVAGSSRDAGRRERFEQRCGARTYADWREMIEKEKPDIVSVATYTPVHAEQTIRCAEAGVRAIWCEKPIATTLVEADAMVAACERSGTLLVINHNRRFKPNHQRIADMIAEGVVGEMRSANLQWASGRLGNVGTHAIDTLRMITRREIVAVSGHLDLSDKPDCRGDDFHDPGVSGMLRMEGDLVATVDAPNYSVAPLLIQVNGSNGRVTIDRRAIVIESWDGVEQSLAEPELDGMSYATQGVVAWLDGGTPFCAPGADAVRTFEAIVGMHVSHDRDAAWVELPLAGEDRERPVHSG